AEFLASIPRGSSSQVYQRRPRAAREQATHTQGSQAIPLQVLEPEKDAQAPSRSPGLNEQEVEKTLAKVVAAGKRKLDGEKPKQKRKRVSKTPGGQASSSSTEVAAPEPEIKDKFSDTIYMKT